jgi:hypothetical protein
MRGEFARGWHRQGRPAGARHEKRAVLSWFILTGPVARPRYAQAISMTDMPPDRLASDPHSPFHDEKMLDRGVGIRFNGVERDNVEEYCVSEGWIRVPVGKSKDRRGNPMTLKISGKVEAYFRGQN